MTGDEDDRNVNVCLGQIALEIETAKSRHSHVEYQTRGNVRTLALQKLVSRCKCLNAESNDRMRLFNASRIDSSSSMTNTIAQLVAHGALSRWSAK